MREYELTVLIHPDKESDLDSTLAKIRDIIKTNGGEVTSEDNWGKRKLAYQIEHQDFAVYVAMKLNIPATGVKKIDSTLNITDDVIRHLIVSVDHKAQAALAEEAKASEE